MWGWRLRLDRWKGLDDGEGADAVQLDVVAELVAGECARRNAHVVLDVAAAEVEVDAEGAVIDGLFARFEASKALLKLVIRIFEVAEGVGGDALEVPADRQAWLLFGGFLEVFVGAVVLAERCAGHANVEKENCLVDYERVARDKLLIFADGFFNGHAVEEEIGVDPDVIEIFVISILCSAVLWTIMPFIVVVGRFLRDSLVVGEAISCTSETGLRCHCNFRGV